MVSNIFPKLAFITGTLVWGLSSLTPTSATSFKESFFLPDSVLSSTYEVTVNVPVVDSKNESSTELLTDLQNRKKDEKHWWYITFITSQILYWLAIVASFGSAIAAAKKDTFPKILLVILTAIPGIVTLVNTTFKYNERASWHSLYDKKLDALIVRLKYDSEEPKTVAKELSTLIQEMSKIEPTINLGGLGQNGSVSPSKE